MNNEQYEISGTILNIGILIGSAIIAPKIWYIYTILILITVLLWYQSREDKVYFLPFFFSGLLDSFASWFSLPWFSMILLCSFFGIYFNRQNSLKTLQTKILFLILCGMVFLSGLWSISINRTVTSFYLICILILLIIFLTKICEFRLQKKYSGVKE